MAGISSSLVLLEETELFTYCTREDLGQKSLIFQIEKSIIFRPHTSPTYLFTPWSRIVLEKLTGFQLLKKFPAFYGTRRFITAFTSARQLSLS